MSSPSFSIKNSVLFVYFNNILRKGNDRQLQFDDLLGLPSDLTSNLSKDNFKIVGNDIKVLSGSEASSLAKLFWRSQGTTFLCLGVLVLINTLLSFGAPLLVGAVVAFVEKKPDISDLNNGVLLVVSLSGILILSAVCSTQVNIRNNLLQLYLKGGLMRSLFDVSLSLKIKDWSQLPRDINQSQARCVYCVLLSILVKVVLLLL
jgi:hypothetical protein